MQEIEIQVLQPEALEGVLKLGDGALVAVAAGELGGHEDLFAGDTGAAQSLADGFLVAVAERGVDGAVAARQGRRDGVFALVRIGDLEHPQAKPRHAHAVGEGGRGLQTVDHVITSR